MLEMWRDIEGYNGHYRVSDIGRIWSNKTKRIMKPHNDKLGYARIILRKDNRSIGCTVHRLVAEALIKNKNHYPCINHKDENPRNNYVSNLEWCSFSYNCRYGTAIERRKVSTDYNAIAAKNRIEVEQRSLKGDLVRTWRTANDCKRELGFDNSAIAKCCRGQMKTAYGYKWSYCG